MAPTYTYEITASATVSEFLLVHQIIMFLDVCTNVTNLINGGDCPKSKWKVIDSYNLLGGCIQDFQEKEMPEGSSDSTSHALHHLCKTKFLSLGKALTEPMGETITALATEEIEDFDPEQGWKLVLSRVKKPLANDEETCAHSVCVEFASWLFDALQ